MGASRDFSQGATGSVYVYRRQDADWFEEQKLKSSDGAQQFGYSVAVSGDVAVVGGDIPTSNPTTQKGAAYVFRFDGTSWLEEQKLTASDGANDDLFGFSVSISGDTIVVGAPGNDAQGGSAGAAYVFRHDGSTWVQEQKLLGAGASTGDGQGFSVSLNGDVAMVGARLDDDRGPNAGAAYVYRFDGSAWQEEQKITPSAGSTAFLFGYSVSLSDGVAMVGSSDNGAGIGLAFVYRWNGVSWAEEQVLAPSDGAFGDQFGFPVALSGDTALVGARLADEGNFDAGTAYVYRFDGATWSESEKLTSEYPANHDHFGHAVALSGGVAVIGVPDDDYLLLSNFGSVSVRELSTVEGDVFADVATPQGAMQQRIGDVVVKPGSGSYLEARFTLENNLKHLDNCYDFRWVTVQTSLVEAGMALGEDPLTGLLPAIDPPRSDGPEPYVYNAADWAAGELAGWVIHEEGLTSVFISERSDPVSPATVRGYSTYLVAADVGGGTFSATNLCPLAGFSWTYDSALGETTLLGDADLNAALTLIADALAAGQSCASPHAGCPGFPGWSPLGSWDLAACDALSPDVASVSLANGGTQSLELNAGPSCANLPYFILGSFSGTSPGISFSTGVVLPLVFDPYFELTLTPIPGVHLGFKGVLDGAGQGAASLVWPPGLDPSLVGLTLYHAFVIRSGSILYASNPAPVTLDP